MSLSKDEGPQASAASWFDRLTMRILLEADEWACILMRSLSNRNDLILRMRRP